MKQDFKDLIKALVFAIMVIIIMIWDSKVGPGGTGGNVVEAASLTEGNEYVIDIGDEEYTITFESMSPGTDVLTLGNVKCQTFTGYRNQCIQLTKYGIKWTGFAMDDISRTLLLAASDYKIYLNK